MPESLSKDTPAEVLTVHPIGLGGANWFIVSVSQDNQQLVLESKTGFPIPGEVQFCEYQGKQAKKAGGGKKGKVGRGAIRRK